MTAYYNEIDPYAARWLRNLIAKGLIASGDVDERSITEVQPDELKRYTQCHFFAGIGVWSHALRTAGWPDSRPVWTGSCPCQPFSSAGQRKGKEDERHLWPAFFRLIRECRPPSIFGEQVAGAAGLDWLDSVCLDLEGADYATAAADLCAAGVGAPHIRQRLYWVADAGQGGCEVEREVGIHDHRQPRPDAAGCGEGGGLADADYQGLEGRCGVQERADERAAGQGGLEGGTSTPHGFWSAPDWLWCRDGKWRPVESGTEPLATGVAARVGRLRAYGNALCAPVATAFVRAYLEL